MADTLSNGIEVSAAEVRIGEAWFRLVVNQFVPPGFVLVFNDAGWAAFANGKQPADCDAAVIRLNTPDHGGPGGE